ncbi:MAG: DUF3617 domain-containing protein [Gammaproteobacteria bacterium]|nr:DUF3617 domain-containing protein [Gammaproteobacteria bacterium]
MYRTLSLILVLPLIAVAQDSSAPEPEAGLYRVTVGVSGQDLPAGLVNESVEQCVTQEELAADSSSILGEHAGMEGCTISSYEWSDGNINMQMHCALEGVDASAESLGSYTASGYELITTMSIKVGDTTVDMQTFVRGERIGDC